MSADTVAPDPLIGQAAHAQAESMPDPIDATPAPTEKVRTTHAVTSEDRSTQIGSALGSLALTWIVYSQLLPFSGKTGFLVFWYVTFIAFYALLTSLTRPKAVVIDRVVTTVVVAAPTIILAALIWMVFSTVTKGLDALTHVNFFTQDMSGVRPDDPFDMGGILHAMAGTLIQVTIAVLIAMPLGVLTAVFMSEIGGPGSKLVRTVVEAMTALPSIVAGLFIYTVLIVGLHYPSSGFAAALALSVMGLPIMARASDVVLRVVPGGLREASYALGAGKWETVWRVVLPTARPGLATALILGVARMVGETSPLLLTSGATSFLNANPTEGAMNSLPLYIYSAMSSGQPAYEVRGYAAATVLLALVLCLFLLARYVARPRSTKR